MAKSAKRNSDRPSAIAADRGQKPAIDAPNDITQIEIARRAYDLYLARGREAGHQVEDWLQAEQELRQRSVVSIV